MKEEISENKENPLTKSDFKAKEELKVEYLIGILIIALIHGLVTSSLGIATTLAVLSVQAVPAVIAGIVTFINKRKYVKILFRTTLVTMTLATFGYLSMLS
jgi:hypothetical protein